MARRSLIAAACVAFLAAGGCSTREATNPLDPHNPATGGAPRWLVPLADDGAVDLTWTVPRYDDLAGVRLLDGGGAVLWSGAAGTVTLRDAPRENGVTARYRLALDLEGGGEIPLPEELATPGIAAPWTLDGDSGTLHRLTPDGRRSRGRFPALDATSVRADAATGGVLVVDFYAGAVRLLDRDGAARWSVDDFERPLFALRVDGGWWITDPGAGAIAFLDTTGARAFADTSFGTPIALAPADSGRVWVSDGDGRVVRFDRGRGALASYDGLANPGVIAATGDGGAWVGDAAGGGLVRLDRDAHAVATHPERTGIVALFPDPLLPGAVWTADRTRRAVVLLDADGADVVRFDGLPVPASLAVAPDGGEIWVADPVLGAVVRFARNGDEIARTTGLSGPVSVSVAFTPPPR